MADKVSSFASLNTDQKLCAMYTMMCDMQEVNTRKLEEIGRQLNDIDTRFGEVENRVSGVEVNNVEVKHEVDKLKQTINALRQDKMIADIIISGVPECESENKDKMFPLVQTIMETLSCDKPYTIVSAHRIGRASDVNGKKKDRSILVQFANKDEKYDILACKKKKTITCDQIVLNGEPVGTNEQKIYFDERLTKSTNDLYYAARKLRSKNLITHTWIRYGNVYVKEDDSTDPIRILDKLQLRAFEKRRKDDSSVEIVAETADRNDTKQPPKKHCSSDDRPNVRFTRRDK